MEFPICSSCLESEGLCSSCQKKLDNKTISEGCIRVSRIIYRIFGKARFPGEVSIKNIIETGSFVLIVCGSGSLEEIGSSDLLMKQISREVGKQVKTIGENAGVKGVLQLLMENVLLIGVDVIYTASGEKLRARMPSGGSLHFPEGDIAQAVKALFGKDVEFARE